MSAPIDIQEMRTNLGYNCEVERKLLLKFVESTRDMLDTLRRDPDAMQNDAYNAKWKEMIAELKIQAESIGAGSIVEIAARAEHQYASAATVKLHLLDLITREFIKAEDFIFTVIGDSAVSNNQ